MKLCYLALLLLPFLASCQTPPTTHEELVERCNKQKSTPAAITAFGNLPGEAIAVWMMTNDDRMNAYHPCAALNMEKYGMNPNVLPSAAGVSPASDGTMVKQKK